MTPTELMERRVAVAFGIEEFPCVGYDNTHWRERHGVLGELHLGCRVDFEGNLHFVHLWHEDDSIFCSYAKEIQKWRVGTIISTSLLNEVMARGLYRLGIEEEEMHMYSELPPLTCHEKMELRLSMPLELRPPHWEVSQ